MVIVDQDVPLRQWSLAPPGPGHTVLADLGNRLPTAIRVRTRINRVPDHQVHRPVVRQAPVGRAVAVPTWQAKLFVQQVLGHGADAAEFEHLREDQRHQVPDLLVVRLDDALLPELVADRQPESEFPLLGLVAQPRQHPSPQDVQFRLAHGAFESEQETVVERRRIVHAVHVRDERLPNGAEVQEPVPVAVVARQPRDLQPEHEPRASEREVRHEPLESGALVATAGGTSQVVVDDNHLRGLPTQLTRVPCQLVLALLTLEMVQNLMLRLLANVHVSVALQMGCLDLCLVHRCAPPLSSSVRWG